MRAEDHRKMQHGLIEREKSKTEVSGKQEVCPFRRILDGLRPYRVFLGRSPALPDVVEGDVAGPLVRHEGRVRARHAPLRVGHQLPHPIDSSMDWAQDNKSRQTKQPNHQTTKAREFR